MKKQKSGGGASTDVNDLLNRLDDLIELAQGLRADVATLKAAGKSPAAANTAKADPIHSKDQFGFIVPKKLAGSFNNASPVVEGHALPNYILEKAKPEELMDIPTVLAGLALPNAVDNRKNMFPVNLLEYIPEDMQRSATRDQKEAFNVLMGKSATGFDMVVLQALNDKGEPDFLYVVEDKLRQKMVVVGPEAVKPDLEASLAKNGVTYVANVDPAATAKAINKFLSEGQNPRAGNIGMLPSRTEVIASSLVKAFSGLCQIPGELLRPDEALSEQNVTLGDAIAVNKSTPAVFISMMKP